MEATTAPVSSSNAATPAATTPQNGAGTKTEAQGSAGKIEQNQTKDKAQEAPAAEDFEDIKIGGVSGKVPKALAKTMKELERGYQAKFQEVAQAKKFLDSRTQNEAAAMAQYAKENPDAFLQRFGIDPDDYSQKRLASFLQQQALSPEQKRQMDLESENKKFKAEAEARDKHHRMTQEQQETLLAQQTLDQEITEAWKDSELPADVYYVKQIAAVMRDSMVLASQRQLDRPLTAKEAATIIKERHESSQPRLFSNMTPERAIRMIGEENFKRIRDWDVTRVSGSAPPDSTGSSSPGNSPASKQTNSGNRPVLNEAQWRHWRETGKLPSTK